MWFYGMLSLILLALGTRLIRISLTGLFVARVVLSTTDADLSTSAMSFFGQGWESRRAQPTRWKEGGEDEDEGHGGMDCGAARRRGSRMQAQGGGYQPPLAGGQGAAAVSRGGSSRSKNGNRHMEPGARYARRRCLVTRPPGADGAS